MKTDLDQRKHYGTVLGQDMPWKYEQDGRFYDASGMEVHKNTGARVTIQEKMARKKKELDALEVQKKRILAEEMALLDEKQEALKAESEELNIQEAAKKVHLINNMMSDINSLKGIRGMFDVLEFPYDDDAHYKTLRATLEKILDAAK